MPVEPNLGVCGHCDELVLVDEPLQPVPVNGGSEFMHRECLMRSVAGSVGHQMRTCSCYGGIGNGDPIGVSVRDAAIKAFWYYMHNRRRVSVLIAISLKVKP